MFFKSNQMMIGKLSGNSILKNVVLSTLTIANTALTIATKTIQKMMKLSIVSKFKIYRNYPKLIS